MISPEMRERRRGWIGASDLAPILGLSEFQNAADIYAAKAFGKDEDQTLAAMMGTEAEYLAMKWAGRLLGERLKTEPRHLFWCESKDGDTAIEPGAYASTGIDHYAVNFDSWFDRDRLYIPVDGKTSGITGPVWGEWGDDWTGQVPHDARIQMHGQMLALDHFNMERSGKPTPMAYVAALIAGRGPVVYEIPRNDEMIEMIREVIPKFWQRVIDKNPPDACYLDIDTAKYLRRTEGKKIAIELPPYELREKDHAALANAFLALSQTTDMLDAYKLLGELSSKASKLRKNERRKAGEPESPYAVITTLLRDAVIGELSDGRSVSFKASTRTSIDKDVLRIRHKEAWDDADCVGETVSRTLRVHKTPTGQEPKV